MGEPVSTTALILPGLIEGGMNILGGIFEGIGADKAAKRQERAGREQQYTGIAQDQANMQFARDTEEVRRQNFLHGFQMALAQMNAFKPPPGGFRQTPDAPSLKDIVQEGSMGERYRQNKLSGGRGKER
jgi:hypothetical protein